MTQVVVGGLHGDEGASSVHSQVVLDVVAQCLPRVFRDTLKHSKTQETKENEHAVPDGRIAVKGGHHVLNDLRAREHIRGEVIHGQTDGNKGHQVKETGRSVGEDARKHPFGVFLGVRDDTPNLLSKDIGAVVDVLGGHLVAVGFCSVCPRHVATAMTETLEPSLWGPC